MHSNHQLPSLGIWSNSLIKWGCVRTLDKTFLVEPPAQDENPTTNTHSLYYLKPWQNDYLLTSSKGLRRGDPKVAELHPYYPQPTTWFWYMYTTETARTVMGKICFHILCLCSGWLVPVFSEPLSADGYKGCIWPPRGKETEFQLIGTVANPILWHLEEHLGNKGFVSLGDRAALRILLTEEYQKSVF